MKKGVRVKIQYCIFTLTPFLQSNQQLAGIQGRMTKKTGTL